TGVPFGELVPVAVVGVGRVRGICAAQAERAPDQAVGAVVLEGRLDALGIFRARAFADAVVGVRFEIHAGPCDANRPAQGVELVGGRDQAAVGLYAPVLAVQVAGAAELAQGIRDQGQSIDVVIGVGRPVRPL